MENENLYKLGLQAQQGDDISMLKIIEMKRPLIRRFSYGDEDRYQYIILKLIEGIKKYKF